MVDLGVLQEEALARVADPLVGVMVEPHVDDVEVRSVLPLDGTPARWLAPVAALSPRNAEAADRHSVRAPGVEGVARPIGVYLWAATVGVDPLEDVAAVGFDRPRELVRSVLDREGSGGPAVGRYSSKVLSGGEDPIAFACGGGGGGGGPEADRRQSRQDNKWLLHVPPTTKVFASVPGQLGQSLRPQGQNNSKYRDLVHPTGSRANYSGPQHMVSGPLYPGRLIDNSPPHKIGRASC